MLRVILDILNQQGKKDGHPRPGMISIQAILSLETVGSRLEPSAPSCSISSWEGESCSQRFKSGVGGKAAQHKSKFFR